MDKGHFVLFRECGELSVSLAHVSPETYGAEECIFHTLQRLRWQRIHFAGLQAMLRFNEWKPRTKFEIIPGCKWWVAKLYEMPQCWGEVISLHPKTIRRSFNCQIKFRPTSSHCWKTVIFHSTNVQHKYVA